MPESLLARVTAIQATVQQPWPAEDGPEVLKAIDVVFPADAGTKKVFNLACAKLIWLQFAKDKSETARLKVVRESLATILAFIAASGIELDDVLDLIVGQVEEVGDGALVTSEDTANLDVLNDEIQRATRLALPAATKQALVKAATDAFAAEMEHVLAGVTARMKDSNPPRQRAEAAMATRYPGLKPAAL